MPTAPTITHAAWAQNQPLSGTLKLFSIMVRWNAVVGATSYRVNIIADADSISDDTTEPFYWWHTDDVPVSGDTFEVESFDGSYSTPTVLDLTPTVVSGPTEISTQVGSNVLSGFTLGPTRPADWQWVISGAPSGISITQKDGADDGGIVVGSPTVEGIYNAVVGVTNYDATANILSVQNFAVTIYVSGERFLEDFHSDTSNTGINISHPKGTVASWNFNAQSELDMILGESFTLHAILRDGNGFLTTGVTALKLIAKLPDRRDGPAILTATSATPTAGTFGAVTGWPLTVLADSDLARKIFDAANTPAGAATASASILLDAQISYTYGGIVRRSSVFKIRLAQPVAQF